ncbi:DUF3732 domain-containing protein [Flavobacterium fluviale]|uniref:DUF3732 domain-containing protein n=1 Tax=Flavobacterium fluviale TaxID=2249356 RepID=A0A344LUU3_9FLAO|nr:DUF3732 domain-containing protein [Flavobacterium fluviale]AXB57685.1 hypothetical protein HYN86_14200 [Flavobacterium fluviale]
MNFYIKQIKLWFNNGSTRELDLLPNKINVITGDSTTGKSSIIRIIDYCFLASSTDISPKFIGENVKWYGINFIINSKEFTIARGSISSSETSNQYYFSDIGIMPETPSSNITEGELKKILSKEFGIDAETNFVGSSSVKANTKISFRYFLWLFCIQRQETLPSGHYLFDKHEESRYKDALSVMKLLDWVIGAQTPKNILLHSEIKKIEVDLAKLEKRQSIEISNKLKFKEILGGLYTKTKELNLINHNIYDDGELIAKLKSLIHNGIGDIDPTPSEVIKLKNQKTEILLKIRNLTGYEKQNKKYQDYLKSDIDSLAPIRYLKDNFSDFLTTKTVVNLIDNLDNEFRSLQLLTKKMIVKDSLTLDVSSEIKKLKSELDEINSKIHEHPESHSIQATEREKYIHLGYVKSKLEDYENDSKTEDYKNKKKELEDKIIEKSEQLDEDPELKRIVLNFLGESIDESLKELQIENYSDYKAFYNESSNRLDLINLKTNERIKWQQLGSASIYLYLHLAFFGGTHNYINRDEENIYIPTFLMLDQVSTPYYDQTRKDKKIEKTDNVDIKDLSETDREKLNKALKYMNNFINGFKKKKKQFQIILLEHIPENVWVEEKLENFHLVDKEFKNGNKLVNPENIN